MPNTNILIASSTISSNTTQIDFSSISQAYSHLRCVLMTRTTWTSTPDDIYISFNDSTFTFSQLMGVSWTGSTNSNFRSYSGGGRTVGVSPSSVNTSNSFGQAEIWIPNYSSTDKFKSILCRSVSPHNGTDRVSATNMAGVIWQTTSAINKISFTCNTQFVSGSSFYLYGLTNS